MRFIRLLKNDLAKEASTWVERQLITVEQAQAICRCYDVDYDTMRSRSTAHRVLGVMGLFFIGLALITVIGANWDTLPRGLRMTGLLALTAGTHGLAMWTYLAGRASLAAGLFFLGNLIYGASIVLIAQIYHLGEHMADGVFLWALGSLPFAVLLRNTWLALFSSLLALVWFYLEFRTGFLAPAFFFTAFPLFLAAELYVLAKARANTVLFLVFVAGLFLWFEAMLYVTWTYGSSWSEPLEELVFVGAALLILARAAGGRLNAGESGKAKDYGAVLCLWTLRLALAWMLVFSFKGPWEGLLSSAWNHQASMWVIVAAIASAALWLGYKTENLPVVLVPVVLCGAVMIVVVSARTRVDPVFLQLADNAALIAAGIWLIVRSTVHGNSHHYFLGVTVILLVAMLRYVDLTGGYLGGAGLFAVLAVLFLGSAWYWRTRHGREVSR